MKLIFCILAGIVLIISIFFTGCMSAGSFPGTSAVHPDPETGIRNWIDAMNARDINRLYELSPEQFRKSISKDQFEKANENNTMFQPGLVFTNYIVMNKTVNQNDADIRVALSIQKPSSQNSTDVQTIQIFENFGLTFEGGEWKIWELPW